MIAWISSAKNTFWIKTMNGTVATANSMYKLLRKWIYTNCPSTLSFI